jgi:two-component system sensor histidine kinase BaeS
MLGELEAMLDEVRPITMQNIQSVTEEVKHLQHLIDDLHQLTSSDIGAVQYDKSVLNLGPLLKLESAKYQSFLQSGGMTFHCSLDKTDMLVNLDFTRICQVLDNIMENSIRYSQGKNLWLSAHKSGENKVLLIIEDDGVGVETNHLPNLFQYLYRVEDSRNRKTGGSGLGLAICEHIIAAHNGTICAQKSQYGGLATIIELPLVEV